MALVALLLAIDLATVLHNAGAYVTQFEQTLSAIVAEEHYHQNWDMLPKEWSERTFNKRARDMVSQLRLLRTHGSEGWLQFRDVIEVDGLPVERTPMDPQSPPRVDRSAKYNIGDIDREMINTPLMALKFIEPANQHRFKFKHVTDRVPATIPKDTEIPGVFRTSTEIWVVEYDESDRPTMIRDSASRKNVPTHGRFWIEADSGRVLMSEIVAENRDVRATIDVSYQSEPLMGFLVPIEMRERYEGKHTGSIVTTRASYGQFRTVEE